MSTFSPPLPPDISVITVTYNSCATLPETLASVRAQVGVTVEHIVVDGGSTDGTVELIRGDGGIEKWVSERDRGIYHAMNKGIALASAPVIGILNSDDVYADEHVLAKVVRAFERSPRTQLLYGNLDYFRGDVSEVVRVWTSRPIYAKYFDHGHVPPHPTVFVRSSVYEDVGDYAEDLPISADYEWLLRAIRLARLPAYHLDEVLVKMRMGGVSTRPSSYLSSMQQVRSAWRRNGLPFPMKLYLLRPLVKIRQLRPFSSGRISA